MKKTKIVAIIGGFGLLILSIIMIAADHVDAPNIVGTSMDLGDLYAFEGDNPDNTVFAVTLQGILTPGNVTENANFDEDVLIEINIDNSGDFVEDLVIQAIKRGDSMYFFGPAAPVETGLISEVLTSSNTNFVRISTNDETFTENNDGMSFFAGPRRDPFFMDFNRSQEVLSGAAAPNGFYPEGQSSDFFNVLNTLAIVIEVPNSMLGSAPTHVGESVGISGLPPAYNVWVSAKRKQ
jgi:hypothetical protein